MRLPRAAALALAAVVTAAAGAARADEAKDIDVWLSMSYRGRRTGWVHWVHRPERDDAGKLTARRVEHHEVFVLTDPSGKQHRVTRSMESILEPDWRLRSYIATFENAAKRQRDTVNVVGDLVKGKRVEWDLQKGDGEGEGEEVADMGHSYEGGSLRAAHPFWLGEQILGLDLERELSYLEFFVDRTATIAYRVIGQDEAGNFLIAARDGPSSFEITLSPDGAPVGQAHVGTDTKLTAVASEAEAKDLSKPAPPSAHERGLGLRLKDDVYSDYFNGFRMRWPGLPWLLERPVMFPTLAIADPARAASIAVLVPPRGVPPQVTLEQFAQNGEQDAGRRHVAYEPGEMKDLEIGGVPAKEVRGKLRLSSGERIFRHVYVRVPPTRAYMLIAYAPPDASEALLAELDRVVAGFSVISAADMNIKGAGTSWRDPRAGYQIEGPKKGWKLQRQPRRPGEPPSHRPEIWLQREDGAGRIYAAAFRAFALGTTLEELASEASGQAEREFGSQVSDVTTEIGKLGERDVLRVRFVASKEEETKSFVVRRIAFIESGRLLVLTTLILDASKEEELLPVIDATAETLRFWEP